MKLLFQNSNLHLSSKNYQLRYSLQTKQLQP